MAVSCRFGHIYWRNPQNFIFRAVHIYKTNTGFIMIIEAIFLQLFTVMVQVSSQNVACLKKSWLNACSYILLELFFWKTFRTFYQSASYTHILFQPSSWAQLYSQKNISIFDADFILLCLYHFCFSHNEKKLVLIWIMIDACFGVSITIFFIDVLI